MTTNRTGKMALIAILSALSFVLMFFQIPLIPSADFLQMEFSILPVLVGLVLLDFKASFVILLIRSVLKLLINGAGLSTYIGMPMNILASAVFLISFAIIWKNQRSLSRFIQAAVVGSLGLTVAMLLANYFYAVPVYAELMNFDIKTILGLGNYLFAMVLPFNLLQGAIWSVAFFIFYQVLRPMLQSYEKQTRTF